LESRRPESAVDTRESVFHSEKEDTQNAQEPREFALDTRPLLREADHAQYLAERSSEPDSSRRDV